MEKNLALWKHFYTGLFVFCLLHFYKWSMRESNPRPNDSSNDLTVNIVKELYTLLRLHTLLVTPQLERYTSYTNFHILLGQYNSIVCSFSSIESDQALYT